MVLVGDSLTDSNFGGLQTGVWMNAISGGKLQYVFNCGVSGNTVANVISRIDNAWDHADSSLRGLLGFPVPIGYITVRIGTNDARASTAIAGTLTTQYATLMAKLASYAEKVIVLAVPPLTGGGNTLTLAYNAHLAATYNSGQFMYVADDADLRDGSGAQISSFFDTDNIHFLPSGVSRAGRTAGADVAFAALVSGYSSPVITDATYVYPAHDQWVNHPAMDGTGGTVPAGFTGTVTTGYSAAHSGTVTGTLSVVSADVGDPNQTPWQDIAITAAGASAWLEITPAVSGRTVSGSDPSWMEQIIEYQFVGFDTTHVSNIRTESRISSDYAAPPLVLQTLGSGTLSLNAIARQKLKRIGASTAGMSDGITINFDSTGVASAIGHLRYRCHSLEG